MDMIVPLRENIGWARRALRHEEVVPGVALCNLSLEQMVNGSPVPCPNLSPGPVLLKSSLCDAAAR